MPRTPPALFPICLAILSCLAALSGCATQVIPVGTRAEVAVPRAPFYKYGPAQTFGPDFQLNQGVIVTVLKRDFGFTRVLTGDGMSGYVASDDLKPAPPATPAPTASSSGARNVTSGRSKRSDLSPTSGLPLFEPGDLPPLPEMGEQPKPAPGFRF
jgi:hypothetical protein